MAHHPPPQDNDVPFDDSHFFSPNFQSLFPLPPPLPSSADLFSPSETTDFFGFLENLNWELDHDLQNAPFPNPHPDGLPTVPSPTEQQLAPPADLPHSLTMDSHLSPPPPPPMAPQIDPRLSMPQGDPFSVPPDSPISPVQAAAPRAESVSATARPKALLSTPQKRLNHILSEQKRRNAIRDGYLQLTTLLAPAGAPPGSGMPTRGRPKGSGTRGRGTKGKSGILFKAREYIRFLEEGKDALLAEVLKVEAAAGIQHPQQT